MKMVLTAHGSADPRSAATTHAVADQIRRLRSGLDVRVAFCEKSTPNLRDVLTGLDGPAVMTPLLLASAYHARVDIPALIADAGVDVLQAETLGEDPRLVRVLAHRLSELGVDRASGDTGVLVVAVGSSHADANAGTATVADALARAAHLQHRVGAAADLVGHPRRGGAELPGDLRLQPGYDPAARELRDHLLHRLCLFRLDSFEIISRCFVPSR